MNRNLFCTHTILLLLVVAGVVCAAPLSGAVPVINANGVVEGATFTQQVAAGGIASIFGSNFAASAVAATVVPLPTVLNGVTVTLNGSPCPLFYVSPTQINVQVRWEVASLSSAALVVTTAAGSSTPYTVPLSPVAPGIFAVGVPSQGAVLISNTSTYAAASGSIPGANSQPAAAGQYVSIYCSGLGAVANQPADGAASPTSKLATITAQIEVGIDDHFAIPSFAGMAPGFVGLYQVDVLVPSGLPGPSATVTLVVNGVTASTMTIAVL
jgi:uncharacterized protein (TIGR03437 family)